MTFAVVKIKRIRPLPRPLPTYKTDLAAGMDLSAAIEKPWRLGPWQREAVPTGFAIELPDGYEAQIRPRSGHAKDDGITVLNTPGTIDPDYRGEIQVILVNLSDKEFEITPEMRIAQLVIAPFARAMLIPVEELSRTSRGASGFGGSGT